MYPIRILHIVGIMNMGGLENLIMNVYRNIDRDKIQFDFLVTREEKGIFDDEIKSLGGKIYNIPHMSKIGYSKYTKTLYNFFINNPQYKIVHCHRDALSSIYLKQAKKANIPVRIAHSHNIRLAETKNIKGMLMTVVKRCCMPFTVRNSTDYFACSKEAGEWLFGNDIDEKFKIIKNGIDTKKYIYDKVDFNIVRKNLNISEETLLIGHVGRFDIQKNHEFLINIINELNKEIDDFKLCLVGDGTLKLDIEKKVESIGLQDKVLFLGIRNDVNELMKAFDIFAFPSLFEGLGIVLIEAQTTGLKCIVSDQVPKEADMQVDLLKYLTIEDTSRWIEEIKSIYTNREQIRRNRFSNYEKIKNNGYDIYNTTNYLQDFYIKNYTNYIKKEGVI